jgi:hypothetical protein
MIDEIFLHVNLLVIMAKKLIVTPTIYKLSMHLLKMMIGKGEMFVFIVLFLTLCKETPKQRGVLVLGAWV